jgi:hypothetical protein
MEILGSIGHGCYNGKTCKEILRVSCACIEGAVADKAHAFTSCGALPNVPNCRGPLGMAYPTGEGDQVKCFASERQQRVTIQQALWYWL